jgi:L-lactate utilization protein LutB
MEKTIKGFWQKRLKSVKKKLTENNFEVFLAEDLEDARNIVLENILPGTGAESVSWGGSGTFLSTGLYELLRDMKGLKVWDTFEKNISRAESLERRRQALLVDLFITGSNAVTEAGQLVNLDMYGNRVGAITFGPRFVAVLAGRNKIVPDLAAAMDRVKNYTAPANAMRLAKKTPCVETGRCESCKSPERICNTWTITEKSLPARRVKVVLINQDAGL